MKAKSKGSRGLRKQQPLSIVSDSINKTNSEIESSVASVFESLSGRNDALPVVKKLRFLIYTRQSAQTAPDSLGSSVVQQVTMVKDILEKAGFDYHSEHFNDIASGADQERRGLRQAMDTVENDESIDGLVVHTLCRLSRNALHAALIVDNLVSKGKHFLEAINISCRLFGPSVPVEIAQSRWTPFLMHAAAAQFERQISQSRSRAHILSRKLENKVVSNVSAYGWKFAACNQFGECLASHSISSLYSQGAIKSSMNLVICQEEIEQALWAIDVCQEQYLVTNTIPKPAALFDHAVAQNVYKNTRSVVYGMLPWFKQCLTDRENTIETRPQQIRNFYHNVKSFIKQSTLRNELPSLLERSIGVIRAKLDESRSCVDNTLESG
ncbi:hypothetical protein BCR33DRAFT_219198 [Rhizoclosmatium globosum]|uniref:Resolvase/invertase-type recombinase catalytic domain-containing protein n=1 Tax=Rhizoclosmatium globosum TaxID=329046 RepID=A0A1Y2CBB6_9FUNG|nr:hypothetical protein BCR33DRAFT_219198 [Rhizoclosmatium globosum]|eukprot:ORY44319.1 hypothetical protein BCR33DRAFT_219198 [Rhizoclosmatium globosum]